MENCIFCNQALVPEDTIFRTQNFFVKIGLGLAAPGHVMVISEKHFICFADLPAGLRGEFLELKNLVFKKVKSAFSAPFLVEYGPLVQTVAHAHLHFIPKKRKETCDYCGYKIENIFQEMEIPPKLLAKNASWEKAVELRQKYGQYVFLQDGPARIFSGPPESFWQLKKLSYRGFFHDKLKITDIPANWRETTAEQLKIDKVKKEITKKLLKLP